MTGSEGSILPEVPCVFFCENNTGLKLTRLLLTSGDNSPFHVYSPKTRTNNMWNYDPGYVDDWRYLEKGGYNPNTGNQFYGRANIAGPQPPSQYVGTYTPNPRFVNRPKTVYNRTKMDPASAAAWAAMQQAHRDAFAKKQLAARIAKNKAMAKARLARTKQKQKYAPVRRQNLQMPRTRNVNIYKKKLQVTGLGSTTSGYMPRNFYCPDCSYPIDECDCGLSPKDKAFADALFRH